MLGWDLDLVDLLTPHPLHARMAQVSARPHVGDSYESHSRVLEITCHGIADHLPDRLIDPTHPS